MIRRHLPADLKPELQRCLGEFKGVQSWLQKLHMDVMNRFDRLERQPKSPYSVSIIDDKDDVDWLRTLAVRGEPQGSTFLETCGRGRGDPAASERVGGVPFDDLVDFHVASSPSGS